jgi:hypothetical protein
MVNQKKNVLLICPYPIGGAPSQRFRFEQYISFNTKFLLGKLENPNSKNPKIKTIQICK